MSVHVADPSVTDVHESDGSVIFAQESDGSVSSSHFSLLLTCIWLVAIIFADGRVNMMPAPTFCCDVPDIAAADVTVIGAPITVVLEPAALNAWKIRRIAATSATEVAWVL